MFPAFIQHQAGNTTTEHADGEPYRFDKGKPILPKVSELRRKLAEIAQIA